jgi:hypothetical protein
MKKVFVRHLAIVLLILSVQSAYSQRTIRMNLERMISDAGMIVHGTVANVETGTDPETKLLATFVTIDILENFYGATEQRVILKLVGGKSKTKRVKFAEMPSFKVGEEIFSLFFAPSKYGFTSPVGMAQGKFSVYTDAVTKQKLVRNGANNTELFSGMKNTTAIAKIAASKRADGNIDAADFSQTIRSLVTILKK